MARKVNPAAQTAFGPIVLAAVEHQEPEGHRLVDDELADIDAVVVLGAGLDTRAYRFARG